ncbi:MAG: hypothetical protein EBZ69_08545 [Alphaproteobacteria bacterium]|nr:hypothetical protein [Alphaproteobacteria bacterium]NDC56834.1 hypothetical protein [Alphaproteobacteria bacterium]NDG04974.1 hypothetical protein [Alphaproteobacteria bacterium]
MKYKTPRMGDGPLPEFTLAQAGAGASVFFLFLFLFVIGNPSILAEAYPGEDGNGHDALPLFILHNIQ